MASALRSLPRGAAIRGFRDIFALSIPGMPFGLVVGLAIADSEIVDTFPGWSSGLIVAAGASQIAAIELLNSGAGVLAVVLTIAVINARHAMYSARLQARYRELPRWFRLVGSYLLLDQVFAIADMLDDRHGQPVTAEYRMAYHLAAGAWLMVMWVSAMAFGLLVGNVIPESWEIGFTVPLLFLGLLVLMVSNVPGLAAAAVAGTIAVLGRSWPSGFGLLVGAVLGVIVGGLLDGRNESRSRQADSSAKGRAA